MQKNRRSRRQPKQPFWRLISNATIKKSAVTPPPAQVRISASLSWEPPRREGQGRIGTVCCLESEQAANLWPNLLPFLSPVCTAACLLLWSPASSSLSPQRPYRGLEAAIIVTIIIIIFFLCTDPVASQPPRLALWSASKKHCAGILGKYPSLPFPSWPCSWWTFCPPRICVVVINSQLLCAQQPHAPSLWCFSLVGCSPSWPKGHRLLSSLESDPTDMHIHPWPKEA